MNGELLFVIAYGMSMVVTGVLSHIYIKREYGKKE